MLSKNEPALQLLPHLPFCISGDVMVNRNKKKIKLQQQKYLKCKYPKYSLYAYSCDNVRNQRFPHHLLPTFNEHWYVLNSLKYFCPEACWNLVLFINKLFTDELKKICKWWFLCKSLSLKWPIGWVPSCQMLHKCSNFPFSWNGSLDACCRSEAVEMIYCDM